MTRIIISLCLISVCTYSANAWPAMDSITGKTIEVFWPEKPSQVAKDGNHEIQYRFKGETEIRLGEVTRWLRECYGRYCPSRRTRTFELNTFSKHGLMYCFPIPEEAPVGLPRVQGSSAAAGRGSEGRRGGGRMLDLLGFEA